MPASGGQSDGPEENVSPYAGRWIARLGDQVVGQGGTPQQALQAAKASRFKETPQVSYVPTSQPLAFHPLLERIRAALPPDQPVYLVGGAVRDAMLGRQTHDLDFVLPGDTLASARRVADALDGDFYTLDRERKYGRIILDQPDGERQVIDFTSFQGPDLESDLRARDFTVNAMAVDIHQPGALLDPLGGAPDLLAKRLRACSNQSFTNDPLRILRGVRLAAAFEFHIQPETRTLMRQSSHLLTGVSPERLRDELFRILDGPRQSACLRALEMLGVLPYVMPELADLKGVTQSPPHIYDVWDHTLEVIQRLNSVLEVLSPIYNAEAAASLHLGLVALRLGRFREQLQDHFEKRLNQDRPLRPLLFLAALYHDIGKPGTRTVDEDGRIRFFQHEDVGARIAAKRARRLQLSNVEADRLKTIVRHHLRPLLLAQTGRAPTRRAIYRFFRDTGPAGVDICLLSLADVMGTYGASLPQSDWAEHLEVVRSLLEAWWERPEESVAPPAIVTGNDLIEELQLQPGPMIGRLLEAIQEAQATGRVQNRRQAISLAQELLLNNTKDE